MKGYHGRGYLPHFDVTNLYQHVCFHLSDSIPRHLIGRLLADLEKIPDSKRHQAKSARIAAWMDNGYGCCALKVHSIADQMQSILLLDHEKRYFLRAWVIMPNHVHCLVKTLPGFELSSIVGGWKRRSVSPINEYLIAMGKVPLSPVWQREYFDRYIRNEKHFMNVISYIHNNPVKAGLTFRPERWRWSSARVLSDAEPRV